MDFRNWLYTERGTQMSAFALNAAGRAGQKQYTPESPMSLLLKRRRDSIANKVVKTDTKQAKPDKLPLSKDFGVKGYAVPNLQAWRPNKTNDAKFVKVHTGKSY